MVFVGPCFLIDTLPGPSVCAQPIFNHSDNCEELPPLLEAETAVAEEACAGSASVRTPNHCNQELPKGSVGVPSWNYC